MATQKLKKNLPSRCTNEHLKMRRKASWARGQELKTQRRSAQERRERANRSRQGPTPWQEAKAKAGWQPPETHKDKPRVVTRTTTYRQIRKFMDDYQGMHGITQSYLDDVHRRWTILGKQLKGGAL